MEDEISDEDLMMSYSGGNADAFEVLYQRHKGPLYRFILRQCGESATEELFQDIWLNIINARSCYKVTASFKTWLYHNARNRIIDHYRRQSVRPVTSETVEASTVSSNPGTQPDRQLESQTLHEQLLAAIAGLPAEQKEAFLLREEAGLSIEQIATTTGTNAETAKSRLRYAMNKLRQQLGDNA